MYFKRTRRPIFKTPATLAALVRAGKKIGNKVRGVEKVDAAQDDADEVKVGQSVVFRTLLLFAVGNMFCYKVDTPDR